jgi:nucleotide-binding universal stress UspA family protein
LLGVTKNNKMKTIIVPTDFSETSENALVYAIEIAKLLEASIVLLHVCRSNGTSDSPSISANELEDKNKKAIHLLEQHMTELSNITFEICVQPKFIIDKIVEIAEERNASLIIFGVSEAGIFDESIVGSTTPDAISKLVTPILMIPSKSKFKIPSKIVFATDYSELENDQPLNALLNFINFFNSKIFIVNVKGKHERTPSKNVAAFIGVRKYLRKVNHSIHRTINESVVDGINQFVSETDAEIVAMIPHKHNFFYRLFNHSNTRKMAFYSHVPILALPEGAKVHVLEKNIYGEEIAPLILDGFYDVDMQGLNGQFYI